MHRGLPKTLHAILILATILVSTLAFLPAPVSAKTPGCGSVIAVSTKLTANIGPCSGNGLVIEAVNGITLNCNGHTISGASYNHVGITLAGTTKVRVENCNVTGFNYGFELSGSSHNTLTKDKANGQSYGFYLDSGSSSNKLTGDTANSNNDGFHLSSSSKNTFTTDTANYNANDGFYLSSSSSNTFTSNKANGNWFEGFYLSDSSSNKLSTNTANSNNDGIYLDPGSSSNSFTKNTANSNYYDGFYLYRSPSNFFTKNLADSNYDGFLIAGGSSDNVFTSNAAGSGGSGNGRLGFEDFTTGSGTAGTGNTYSLNECSLNSYGGSVPSELCSPQD